MPKFSANPHRQDPYTNFKFRVKIGNNSVAGLSKCSAVKKTTEAVEWREAGSSSIVTKIPGRTKYEPITLEGGLTHDRAFHDWARLTNHPAGDAAGSGKEYRKELVIEVLNAQGVPAIAFNIHRAWVSEYQALGEMDANANAVAIETVKFEYEGFEIDENVVEPTET